MVGNTRGRHLTKEMRILGGKAKHPNKGFRSNRELASIAGKKGGLISRGKSKQ